MFNGDGSFALPAPEVPATASAAQVKITKPSLASGPSTTNIAEVAKPNAPSTNPKSDAPDDDVDEEDDMLIYEGERDIDDEYEDDYY